LFAVENVAVEHVDRVLAEIEMQAERVLGSFGPKEYDALGTANIPKGGLLNRVLEHIGVSYASRSVPISDASQTAVRKRNAEVSRKPIMKWMKASSGRAMPSKMAPPPSKRGPSRKISIVKMAQPKAKPGPQSTSEIELALAKPIGVSKKFRLLDGTTPSYGLNVGGLTMTHVGCTT
jgi:hypothetical protein